MTRETLLIEKKFMYGKDIYLLQQSDGGDKTYYISSPGLLGHHIANVKSITKKYVTVYTYIFGKKFTHKLVIKQMEYVNNKSNQI